ncbi:MAG: SidC [Legionellales bacterium]
MKLPLKERPFVKYLYISPENTVHVFMPVVSGTDIGLDNTCKAVFSLQEFWNKGSNSTQKACVKGELLEYKEDLESDLSLLGADTPLAQQKQKRLTQINAYLEVVRHLEQHQELRCLNKGIPSYPRPLVELMQARATSNLYSMVLRPTDEDGYLRLEAANPLFSVAHKSIARGITNSVSPLQQALIAAYKPLTYEAKNLKSQVIQRTLSQLPVNPPVDFEFLRKILGETVKELLKVSVDFTKTQQGTGINQEYMDRAMDFDAQTTAQEYAEALLGYCAPNLFDAEIESPFNSLIKAEDWSIATQFLLGIINIYCVSENIVSKDTNFGRILDSNPDLSTSLAQTLATAQKAHKSIEDHVVSWINAHIKDFNLNTALSQEDFKVIQETFVKRYAAIKNSPHYDEFVVLDRKRKGDFVIHQGAICTSFAKFVNSPLLGLEAELTQPLEDACAEAHTLSTEIPHKNALVQAEVEIHTKTMDDRALQALYERITTYKDSDLKRQLLAQLKQERPDFKPKINARQFLQHVAYGEQKDAESLLQQDAILAQELLTSRETPFTDYSGRTFTCTAYEYAYWAKDTHMCRMLERYMDENTKQELLKRVHNIEELTGPEFFNTPKGLVYTQKGQEHRSAHFDLTPLKQALQTYIEATEKNLKVAYMDWEALNEPWIKVGLPQRDLPAHIAQEYCNPNRTFAAVCKNASLLDASNPANLARQLEFYNYETISSDFWFIRDSYLADSGLGFSFAIFGPTTFYGNNARGAAEGPSNPRIDLAVIEAIDKVRTEDLKKSLDNLAAPACPREQQSYSS